MWKECKHEFGSVARFRITRQSIFPIGQHRSLPQALGVCPAGSQGACVFDSGGAVETIVTTKAYRTYATRTSEDWYPSARLNSLVQSASITIQGSHQGIPCDYEPLIGDGLVCAYKQSRGALVVLRLPAPVLF